MSIEYPIKLSFYFDRIKQRPIPMLKPPDKLLNFCGVVVQITFTLSTLLLGIITQTGKRNTLANENACHIRTERGLTEQVYFLKK